MELLPVTLRSLVGEYANLVIPNDLTEFITIDNITDYIIKAIDYDKLKLLKDILALNIVDIGSCEDFGIAKTSVRQTSTNIISKPVGDKKLIYGESLLSRACLKDSKESIVYSSNLLRVRGYLYNNVIFNLLGTNKPNTLKYLLHNLKIVDDNDVFVSKAYNSRVQCTGVKKCPTQFCTCNLRCLLDHGIKYDMTFIKSAVDHEDLEMLQLLLNHIDQARPNARVYRQALKQAIKSQLWDFADLLVKHCKFQQDEMRSFYDITVSQIWARYNQ